MAPPASAMKRRRFGVMVGIAAYPPNGLWGLVSLSDGEPCRSGPVATVSEPLPRRNTANRQGVSLDLVRGAIRPSDRGVCLGRNPSFKRLALRQCDGLHEHLGVADVVGQDQDEPGVEIGARLV